MGRAGSEERRARGEGEDKAKYIGPMRLTCYTPV